MIKLPAPTTPSRRHFLGAAPILGIGVCMGWQAALAQQDVLLKDGDSDAMSIDYRSDASTVDTAKFPKYAKGQNCRSCSLYTEEKGASTGACAIVYGKVVEAKGWCSAWEKRPA